MSISTIRHSFYSRLISLCLLVTFVVTTSTTSYAQVIATKENGIMRLPAPGTMVNLSSSFVPLMITGLRVHPENPLLMDFIVNTGNMEMNSDQVKKESNRLIKYFLACLTIPENNQWVNLSPYEKQRIVPEDLGGTVLGEDMLAQDYLLKQLTASLIYPERNLGKNFWDKVYTKASQMYGTTQIPVNTFNKVWILPQYAKVYEHKDTVLVVKSHLKVMLDEDYLALSHDVIPAKAGIHTLGSTIVRQIILPAIEQEVNQGQNFTQLRQIYNSMILAVWFKKNLKQALLNQVYTGRSKVNGVNADDPSIKERIYQQYLQAYKKGVFNYIKEEPAEGATIARKYFSGGIVRFDAGQLQSATADEAMKAVVSQPGQYFLERGLTQGANEYPIINKDAAMRAGGPGGEKKGIIGKTVALQIEGKWIPLQATASTLSFSRARVVFSHAQEVGPSVIAEDQRELIIERKGKNKYFINPVELPGLVQIENLRSQISLKDGFNFIFGFSGKKIVVSNQNNGSVVTVRSAGKNYSIKPGKKKDFDPQQKIQISFGENEKIILNYENEHLNIAEPFLLGTEDAVIFYGSNQLNDHLLQVSGRSTDSVGIMDMSNGRTQIFYELIKEDKAMSIADLKTLKGAEVKIRTILEKQYKAGEITAEVFNNALDNTYKNFYEWTTDENIFSIDPSIRLTNLDAIRHGRWDDIIEAYRQEVAFGTAGIRGKAALNYDDFRKLVKMGPLGNYLKGPNTINAFKLLKTTAGVIRFAKESGRKRIVIGYDSRIGGEQYANMIARLFIAQSTADHQFKIFLFDEANPFPELSFGITVKELKGDIGLFLSASHNPADYHGYKITLGNGAQLNQKSKDAVVGAIAKVKNSGIVLANSLADAKPDQIVWLGGKKQLRGKNYYGFELVDMHQLYVKQLKKFILNQTTIRAFASKVRIGYAAFNGAGRKTAPRVLRESGFTNLKVITKLQKLDGRFPAWKFGQQPDPGDPISAEIAVKEFIAEYGQKAFDDLDILIGTDPDADRMGLVVKVPKAQQKYYGKYRLLSANDAWTLLLWYRLSMKKQMELFKNIKRHKIVFSHVTTDALEAVARLFGIESVGKLMDMTGTQDRGAHISGRRTWVGFTYLAGSLEDMEQAGNFVEILCEEANGMSIQGHTRDKDGVLAALLLAEVAAYAKSQNTTIFELLDKVYKLIGFYATANKPLPRIGSFEKAAGISEKIKIIQKSEQWVGLANERAATNNPFYIAGKKVIGAMLFKSGRIDKTHYVGIPDEGVRFFFEDKTMRPGEPFTNSKNYITIRASGTSQALRFYTQVYSKEFTSKSKAADYLEAERIALEAQKQILNETGLVKYLAFVDQQLKSLDYQQNGATKKGEAIGKNISFKLKSVEERAHGTPGTIYNVVARGGFNWYDRKYKRDLIFMSVLSEMDSISEKGHARKGFLLSFVYSSGRRLIKHDIFIEPEEIRMDLIETILKRLNTSKVKSDFGSLIGKSKNQKQGDKELVKFLIQKIKAIAQDSESDKAVLAINPNGGIDLNSKYLNLQNEGQKVNISFDAAVIARFRRGDFSGVTIKILDVVPISIIPLLN